MNSKSKINIVEGVLMGILIVSADIAEAVGTFAIAIPVIGQLFPIIAWIYGFAISAIVIFWLIMKGVSIKWFLGGSGLELIPIINALPLRSAAILTTIAMDRAPERIKGAVNAATGKPKILKAAAKPTK